MAVLWRSNEHKGVIDFSYRPASDPASSPTGAGGNKNTFLEKHLRICSPLPDEADMKNAVKAVFDDRRKSKNAAVRSVSGLSKPKKEIYGTIKPPANSTYFIGPAGFQETNAWIERYVTASSTHAEVPILGDGVVVTYHDDTATYTVAKSGKIKLSIAVGDVTTFKDSRGKPLSMQSKVVYHWGGLVP